MREHSQERIDESVLGGILNNTTSMLAYQKSDYILLIKKQKSKQYCTLYVSDCCQNFWIEKIDMEYCEQLKADMKIRCSIESFAKHLSTALKDCKQLKMSDDQMPVIEFSLKLSEGIVIKCSIKPSIKINCEQNKTEYKQLIRSFFKQLYEAKQQQIHKIRQENQSKGDNPEILSRKSDKPFIKKVLDLPQKKQAPIDMKKRDLINPQRKKRKHQGIKIQTLE